MYSLEEKEEWNVFKKIRLRLRFAAAIAFVRCWCMGVGCIETCQKYAENCDCV